MGVATSALASVTTPIKIVYNLVYDNYKQFQELNKRIDADPGLPKDSPTKSFWLEDPPYPELVDIRSTELPEKADIVIVGSGITGVAVARSLLESASSTEPEDGPSVVVLEARQLCSGATGRNGGHIKSSPHEMLAQLMHNTGLSGERAAALVRFQLNHLNLMVDLCASDPLLKEAAECREVETVDIFVDEGRFKEAQHMVSELNKWVPEFEIKVWSAEEAQEKFSTGPHVVGAMSYKAGALWPYRFVTSIWKSLLDSNPGKLSIETSTPVQSVETDTTTKDSSHPFRVVTPRGVVHARHVVHCVNGFTTQLLPRLRRKMTSMRGHMSAQRPGSRFPDLDGSRSWSIVFHSGYDYITQRPTRMVVGKDGKEYRQPGEVMAGGGFVRSVQNGIDQLGVYDDTTLDLFTATHLHGILPATFSPHWGNNIGSSETKDVGDGHVERIWTGILGCTADLVPFVGRLDPRLTGRDASKDSAEWISAAYFGDGMVWAWLCGTALGYMVAGREKEDLPARLGRPAGRVIDWFPSELLVAYERVNKIDMADLADLDI